MGQVRYVLHEMPLLRVVQLGGNRGHQVVGGRGNQTAEKRNSNTESAFEDNARPTRVPSGLIARSAGETSDPIAYPLPLPA